MVYFFEMIARLLAFDIGWFAAQIMANLFWIFVVTALMYLFLEGKKVVKGVVLFFFLAHAWIAAGALYDVAILVASFLGIYYITKFAVLQISESSPGFRRYIILIAAIQGFAMIMIYNAFLK